MESESSEPLGGLFGTTVIGARFVDAVTICIFDYKPKQRRAKKRCPQKDPKVLEVSRLGQRTFCIAGVEQGPIIDKVLQLLQIIGKEAVFYSANVTAIMLRRNALVVGWDDAVRAGVCEINDGHIFKRKNLVAMGPGRAEVAWFLPSRLFKNISVEVGLILLRTVIEFINKKAPYKILIINQEGTKIMTYTENDIEEEWMDE